MFLILFIITLVNTLHAHTCTCTPYPLLGSPSTLRLRGLTQDPDDIASASASGASSHTSISSHSRRRHSSCCVEPGFRPVVFALRQPGSTAVAARQIPRFPEQHMRVALHMRATPGAGLQRDSSSLVSHRSAHAPVTGRASRHDRHTREADSDTPPCSGMFSMLRSSEDDSSSSPSCVHSLVRLFSRHFHRHEPAEGIGALGWRGWQAGFAK